MLKMLVVCLVSFGRSRCLFVLGILFAAACCAARMFFGFMFLPFVSEDCFRPLRALVAIKGAYPRSVVVGDLFLLARTYMHFGHADDAMTVGQTDLLG